MRRPSPGRMLGGIGDRLRGVKERAVAAGGFAARLPRAIGDGASAFWRSLPPTARHRLVAALAAVAAIVLVALLAVPNLPCELPGGDRCAPEDDAIALVPGGALAYVHANVDPETDQYDAAAELLSRTPLVGRQVLGQLLALTPGGTGAPGSFADEIAPWFGGEAAVAIVGSRGRAQQVQLLEAEDPEGAARYAETLTAGRPQPQRYRDVEITEDQRGLASAVVDGFLVLGSTTGVRAIVDVATDAEDADSSLADDPAAADVLESLPEHRVAEAYLSEDGLAQFVSSRQSPLAALEPFLHADASRGAGVALSAEEDGWALASRSSLDPERAGSRPGFFGAFEPFDPELPERLAPETLAYVGLGEARATAEALLRQATARAPGIAEGFTSLVERLQRDAGVDLVDDLLPALRGEAALAVVPRERGETAAQGTGLPGQEPPETLTPGAGSAPYVMVLATGVDEERARDALARLQGPLAEALDPELGAPVFDEERIGDVRAQVLRASPTAHLAYAVFDATLAAATDPAGVRRAVEGGGRSLADTEGFERATDELSEEPALLAYLDVTGLLEFGERSGLAEDPAYAALAPDLRRLTSFALEVTGEESQLAADARLVVGPGEEAQDE